MWIHREVYQYGIDGFVGRRIGRGDVMKLTYKEPGFSYSLKSIMEFQQEETTDYWMDSLYYFFPELDKERVLCLKGNERSTYIEEILKQVYEKKCGLMNEKIIAYQAHWGKYKRQITEAFSEAFQMDCEKCLEDITGNITLNPIGPRYLKEHTFDVFYLNSEKGALGAALHEMIHFAWFEVWHRHFQDSEEEYEIPHLKWILSEMTVEPIMRDKRLSSINPYFERDYEKNQNGCVYDCFYNMKIEGKLVLDTLYEMYRQEKIEDYMERAYTWCQKYEQEIRSKMKGVI